MNKNFLLVFVIGYFLQSCVKDQPTCPELPTGSIEIELVHMWGNQPLTSNSTWLLDATGDSLNISDIKGLISNFQLSNYVQDKVQFDQVVYFKLSDPQSNKFVLKNIPDNSYTQLSFYLGLDSTTNHSDITIYPKNHPLSVYRAGGEMHWNWADGFIFSSVQGNYRDKNQTKGFSYHIGMDQNLVRSSVIFPDFHITGNARVVQIKVDWLEMLHDPYTIKIANQDVTHSTSGDTLANQLSVNMSDMFSLLSVK
jgi:hypothetical protein